MAKRPLRFNSKKVASYSYDDPVVDPRFRQEQDLPNPRKAARGPLRPMNEPQAVYLAAIERGGLVFGIGPAGTGKTYIAAAYAADQLMAKAVSKVIVTRPNIEVGQGMGFLPGELEEKYRPYLAPVREIMIERMGASRFEYALKAEQISPQPLAYMRGATFNDAIVILDEAQNTTPAEMKMFLTRVGKNCTVIIDGDVDQCDLAGPSGLTDALRRIAHLDEVTICEFEDEDIVRSGLVREIIRAYRNS